MEEIRSSDARLISIGFLNQGAGVWLLNPGMEIYIFRARTNFFPVLCQVPRCKKFRFAPAVCV